MKKMNKIIIIINKYLKIKFNILNILYEFFNTTKKIDQFKKSF